MVHRIERIVLFSLYVPFVSQVKGYVCTCKKMGGAGGGSVDGINEYGTVLRESLDSSATLRETIG